MDVTEAVLRARQFIKTLYAEEPVAEVGIEEIDFDDEKALWTVTIGFRRLWDRPQPIEAAAGGDHASPRVYKAVSIRDHDKQVVSMKGRMFPESS